MNVEKIIDNISFKVFTLSSIAFSNMFAFSIKNINLICAILLNALGLIAVILLIIERRKKIKANKMDLEIKSMELEQRRRDFEAWKGKNKTF